MRSALKLLRKDWLWTLGAAAVLAVLFLNRGMRRLVAHALELARLERQVQSLEKEERDLRSSIAAAGSDDRALERAARRELGYVKPGEIEYRFPPPAGKRR